MAGEELAVWQAAEAVAAEGLSAQDSAVSATHVQPEPASASAQRAPVGWVPAGTTPAESIIGWEAVAGSIPGDIAGLATGCDCLDVRRLDSRMRAALRAMAQSDWQLGRLLRLFHDLRLERVLGFSSRSAYVRERLGCSTRKARALIALERHGFSAPAVHDAYRAGRLSWLRATTLLPVVSETTEIEWLARAEQVTIRRLADEVGWALARRDGLVPIAPPPRDAELRRVVRQLCSPGAWAPCDSDISFAGPGSVVRLFRTAVAAFTRPGDCTLAGSRGPAAPRRGHVVAATPPSRPGLRARRVALHRSGLHGEAQAARSPPALPLMRRAQRARQPDHALRLAPPPRHPRRPWRYHPRLGPRTGRRTMGSRSRLGPPAAAAHDRRSLSGIARRRGAGQLGLGLGSHCG